MDPSLVLTALAELAPTGQSRETTLDVTGGRAPVWLPDPHAPRKSAPLNRLAGMDVLHRDERLLRRGWAWVLGTTEVAGTKRKVRLPLLAEPVRMERERRGYRIFPAGDLEVTPLITDRAVAAQLESDADTAVGVDWQLNARSYDWLREAAVAAGLAVTGVSVPSPPDGSVGLPGRDWPPVAPEEGLVAVAAAGLYLARDVYSGGVADTLLNWAGRDGLSDTALAAIYATAGGAPAPVPPDLPAGGSELDGDSGEVSSPLPLNTAQVQVVRRARRERVAVVSGPPGSGKSHAVVAAALDVVDRGGSVLLATQSTHAADVLGELLDRYPGPTPVLFGDAEHRQKIAAELSAGADRGYDDRTLRADRAAVAAAAGRVRQLTAAVDAALELERQAAELSDWEPVLGALRAEVPGAFAAGADLAAARARADRAEAPAGGAGWWRRLRQRWAQRRLRSALGAGAGVPLDRLRAAVTAARCAQAAAELAAAGGTDLGPVWQRLHDAEQELARAVGKAMRHRAGSARRWDPHARRSAAALASALRAGRNRRRELLAGMDGAALVRALPLWVGTAADTGDLLPPVPGLFDLVILDEASHLDQLRAAPVLARAKRALIVGDPRQLRFVSFVADVDIAATLHRHGLDDRVDVRRVSAYDLAAGAAPVTWLDEHYRSVPHLIEFSAEKFYSGDSRGGARGLAVATRHPANEAEDVIDLVRVPDGAVGRGVNAAEVAAAVRVVRELAAAGRTGIAVVSPFRAQADALEAALLKAFSVPELTRLGLRVGTVHAFQGSEAATVVASLGLVDDDSPARIRFVADPQLFNVLVTRARERMVVVTSLRPDRAGESPAAAGLVGDYLAFSDRAAARAAAEAANNSGPASSAYSPSDLPADDWTRALAVELARSGLPVRGDYPVGHWRVDLVLGEGAAAVGLITRVHHQGGVAHRQRQRFLVRAGWRLVDAYASRWGGDPVPAALDLVAEVNSSAGGRNQVGAAPLSVTPSSGAVTPSSGDAAVG